MSDHLVIPQRIEGRLRADQEHPPLRPETPLFDPAAYACFLAAHTERVLLGTFVYLPALRHPFSTARAFLTLDHVSGGRARLGVGAGWLTSEFEVCELDPATRGRRLDEAIAVCRQLWQEKRVEHRGEFFSFGSVSFEPKPVQTPAIPILVGGESGRALRRAATLGDGWLGMGHTPASAADRVSRLRSLREAAGRADAPFEVTLMGQVRFPEDAQRYEAAGVDRLIVVPWRRSVEAVESLEAFAEKLSLSRGSPADLP